MSALTRRAFLGLAAAIGIDALARPSLIIAQAARETLAPETWTLGPYCASADVTPKNQWEWETEFGTYWKHKSGFQNAFEGAQTGSDTFSQRLQFFQKMIETAKTIKDPYLQLAGVTQFCREAFKVTPRPQPRNEDIAGCAKWVFPLEKTIGLGEGLCSEYATAIAAAMEAVTGSKKSTYLLAVEVKENAESHLMDVTPIGTDLLISDAITNQWPMLVADYFQHHLGARRWKPKALLNTNGDVLLVYDQPSPGIVYAQKPIKANPSPADTSALDEIMRLGTQSGALDRPSLKQLLAKNQVPAYVRAALQ